MKKLLFSIFLILIPFVASADCHTSARPCMETRVFDLAANTSIDKYVNDLNQETTYHAPSFEEVEDIATQSFGIYDLENNYSAYRRGLAQFNTSELNGKIIDKVELFRNFVYGTPVGAPLYEFRYYIGNWGNVPLTMDEETFNGGYLAFTEIGASFENPAWIDLGAVGRERINKSGVTTIKFHNPYNDLYPNGPAEASAVGYFATYAGEPTKLRVTFHDGITTIHGRRTALLGLGKVAGGYMKR